MLPRGLAPGRNGRARDDAERPFWISFSDLMSALMVLFLVSMTVALLAITHEISASADEKTQRQADIDALLQLLHAATADHPGVTLRGNTLDFGERARFDTDSHRLGVEPAALLRRFAPALLKIARDPAGERWLKRIVVDGYADARGSYLHNLNLSLQRAERVLCILLAPAGSAPDALGDDDRRLVRELFFVGGSSFNLQRASAEASRRIEMRLEFLEPDESRPRMPAPPLDHDPRCPLDGRG